MSQSAKLSNNLIAKKLLFLQAFLVFCLGLLGALASKEAALSAFLGAGVVLFSSAIFAVFVFKHKGANKAKSILGAIYLGELVKIFTVCFSFWLVLATWPNIEVLWFIGAFVLAQISFFLAMFL